MKKENKRKNIQTTIVKLANSNQNALLNIQGFFMNTTTKISKKYEDFIIPKKDKKYISKEAILQKVALQF